MNEHIFEKFKNPPIKEAVFILTLAKSLSIEKIKELSRDSDLIKKYPIFQASIQNNVRIDTKKDSSLTSVQKLQDGFIFRTSKEMPEWVLQLRRNSILLHKVGNYSTWENLVNEFKEISIILYRKFGNELQIKDIGIRYINHIPISQTQSLQEWFRLLPQSIEGVPINLNKFLLQLSLEKDGISGLIIESVLQINSILNFVIDIRVTKPLKELHIEFDNLESHLNEIRALKNQVFFSIITENLKTKFR